MLQWKESVNFGKMVHCNAYNRFEDSRRRLSNEKSTFPTKVSRKNTLFCFPKNPALRRRWVQNLRLENFVVKNHSKLRERPFEEDQFEVSPKLIESLGMIGKKQLKLKRDAVPTIFDRGSPKSSGQVQGKKSFKRKKVSNLQTKFQSKFEYLSSRPKKLSPRKRYGAYTKRQRLEVSRFEYFFSSNQPSILEGQGRLHSFPCPFILFSVRATIV